MLQGQDSRGRYGRGRAQRRNREGGPSVKWFVSQGQWLSTKHIYSSKQYVWLYLVCL